MATTQFEWPWQYNFPPFFTIQPNMATQAKQCEAWSELILSYYKHNKEYRLDVTEAHGSPLFSNEAIKRKLAMDDIRMVLDTLAKVYNFYFVILISIVGGIGGVK